MATPRKSQKPATVTLSPTLSPAETLMVCGYEFVEAPGYDYIRQTGRKVFVGEIEGQRFVVSREHPDAVYVMTDRYGAILAERTYADDLLTSAISTCDRWVSDSKKQAQKSRELRRLFERALNDAATTKGE